VPEELKARTDTSGEASLRGHLKAEGASSWPLELPRQKMLPKRRVASCATARNACTIGILCRFC
jgi:hypothetical protein